jgi:hypothetical protein
VSSLFDDLVFAVSTKSATYSSAPGISGMKPKKPDFLVIKVPAFTAD